MSTAVLEKEEIISFTAVPQRYGYIIRIAGQGTQTFYVHAWYFQEAICGNYKGRIRSHKVYDSGMEKIEMDMPLNRFIKIASSCPMPTRKTKKERQE